MKKKHAFGISNYEPKPEDKDRIDPIAHRIPQAKKLLFTDLAIKHQAFLPGVGKYHKEWKWEKDMILDGKIRFTKEPRLTDEARILRNSKKKHKCSPGPAAYDNGEHKLYTYGQVHGTMESKSERKMLCDEAEDIVWRNQTDATYEILDPVSLPQPFITLVFDFSTVQI